jgi:hypothetical protein
MYVWSLPTEASRGKFTILLLEKLQKYNEMLTNHSRPGATASCL